MSTDVFVMPLWRHKVGDFQTALERSGLAPQVNYVSAGGLVSRVPWRSRYAKWRAKHSVKRVARDVAEVNGHSIAWRDEGDVVYAEQLHTAHPLIAYLWWLDRRDLMPTFVLPPEGGPEAAPFWQTAPERLPSCPHLSGCSYYDDYLLPVEFEQVARVEPYKIFGTWDVERRVCSSPRALREMATVNELLRVPDRYEPEESDPLSFVKVTFNRVREVLQLSVNHGLPVIFWS